MVQTTQLEIGKLDFRGYILGASALMFLEDYSLFFSSGVGSDTLLCWGE
jgi:hypothetical protein